MNSLEIAQQATLVPIDEIAERVGLQQDEVDPYGRYKAKIALSAVDRLADRPDGKLICVAGMTPTAAGEGKTTTLVGLTQGLGAIGKRSLACLREPSLGPVFGVKGGAAGGGWTQIVPMEDLNLHFTGDIHAIGAANNLLAALIDAHIHHGNQLDIDPNNITWRRAIDMNDRALRHNVVALGGKTNGLPRETGFDITAASEVMALMAVTRDLKDLRERLARITIGYSRDGRPITAEDLGAAGSMTVLLREALKPNLVQTLEGQPCLMHTGPFANIASGNNSLVADRIGMKLADYIVTESGFGADMGMEKFFDIVCRFGGLTPSAVVLVCTVRAIRHHAGGDEGDLEEGFANVAHHLQVIKKFGLPAVVAVNRRPGDSEEDVEAVRQLALAAGAHGAEVNEGFEKGGQGVTKLAEAVVAACDAPSDFRFLYEDSASIEEKIEAVATQAYGADGINILPAAQAKIEQFTKDGLGNFPVCMAKTQLSLTADPKKLGAPKGFTVDIRDIRAYTGAGWLVPLCGDIMQMPGLGPQPAAQKIDIDEQGNTVGLF
jgi:formyltetrahydrofolate synthetase